ncbi:MAG: hypothetical protein NTZ16_12515 [Verrucomicrobia bacterium]|nr:hypothetical protein [Verrucomicrobiota bacterium]
MSKLTKQSPDWHAKVAAELNKDFSEINALEMTARKRRVYLGLKFIWAKEMGKADKSIPHGEFMPWLKKNCPAIPIGTIGDYITEARSVCERMGWQISEIPKFGDRLGFEVSPHRLLELPAKDLKPEARKQQQLLLDLIDGNGKFRAVTEYKQVEDGGDVGERKNKVGRAKGEGGREAAPTCDIEGIVKFNRESALRKMGKVDHELGKLGVNFMSQPDDILQAWQSTLERTQRCVNEWLNTPLAKRNREAMERVQKLYLKS